MREEPTTDQVEDAVDDMEAEDASEELGEQVYDDELTEDEVMARDMVSYIAGHLVDDKESIDVGTEWDGDRLKVILRVADGDKGKVIGRNGRVVRAMQSLLRVSAVKSNIRASLDVV